MNKLVTRDALNYRKVTDKPRPKEEKKEEAAAAAAVEEAEKAAETTEVKMETDESEVPAVPETPDDETLALGELAFHRLLIQIT